MASRRKKSSSDQYAAELPRDENGEWDWNALGNLLTTHLLAETSSVSGEDDEDEQLQPRKDSNSTPPQWVSAYEKYDVAVFRKRVKGSPLTCWLGRGVIDVPLSEISSFLKDVDNNLSWDKFLVEARYLKTLSESEAHTDYIGYQRFEINQCVLSAKRDMLYYVRCLHTDDGKYVQAAFSVEDPDYPPIHGVKRLEIYRGTGFVLEPYKGNKSRTLVNYLAHLDLKGLPAMLHNYVMKRHPLALHYIRRHFMEPGAQTRARDYDDSPSLPHTNPPSASPSHYFEDVVPFSDFTRGRHMYMPTEVGREHGSSEPGIFIRDDTAQ